MKKRVLKKLRRELPKGYAETLAKTCGCTVQQIGRIFNQDRRDNFEVIKAAIRLKDEYQTQLSQEEIQLEKAIN